MGSRFYIDKFDVHTTSDIQSLPDRDKKMCIVSIVGKSPYLPFSSKATNVNSFIKVDIFRGMDDRSWVSGDCTCRIEGYYDTNAGVIFLHLLSTYDTSVMAELSQRLQQNKDNKDLPSILRTSEYSHARALLFIFSISHIVMVVHPGTSFDITYIRLFKTLDAIRQKIQPMITDLLKRLPMLSKDWVMSGRPCSPRVLFVFEASRIDPLLTNNDNDSSKNRNSKLCPLKELQHFIEDQIYRILRKTRIITNTSNNSLFALPSNQEFVFVHAKTSSVKDLINFYLNKLKSNCSLSDERDSSRSKSYQLNRRQTRIGSSSSSNDRQDDESMKSSSKLNLTSTPRSASVSSSSELPSVTTTATSSSSSVSVDNQFSQFLKQHINLALNKGFDDNIGRNPVSAIFEIPSLLSWFNVVTKLHAVFWSDEMESKIETYFNSMKSMLDIDVKFSEGHCTKVLPMAETAYHDGLPQHYTLAYHTSKLRQAVAVFMQHARGPACSQFVKKLEEDCNSFWQNGRQMCEEISLTGNHCINELHRLPDMPETELTKHLPIMSHCSQVKTKSACNCGRRQAEREDPFEHRMANYDFYQRMEQQCCFKLEHYEMSVFKPSSNEVRPAEPINMQNVVTLTDEPESPNTLRKESSKFDIAMGGMSSLSLALSLGQSGCSDLFINDSETVASNSDKSPDVDDDDDGNDDDDDDDDDGNIVTIEEDDEEEEERPTETFSASLSALRQHSTTEYLPGMLHSDSLPGLLPKFPSWALTKLGEYSTYNPSQGIDQPGFLQPPNFLLPIDVTVRIDKEQTQDVTSKKLKTKKSLKEVVQLSRLFIGFEYECPRGHRFFLSSPDRIFKTSSNAIFKETGHKVLNHDMPLYFVCSCRSQGQYVAQLMRIHLAIPEGGNIEVKLKPKVQPAPPPCPFFFPEADECLVLNSGIWVLRLPSVYLGETSPYRMPTNPQQLSACRFIKGFMTVAENQLS